MTKKPVGIYDVVSLLVAGKC